MLKPKKIGGREFEEMILGRQGEEVSFFGYKPLKASVLESVQNSPVIIPTEFFSKLREFVKRYLISLGVREKLLASETLDTHADVNYGADFVFSLEMESHPFVTVDLFSVDDETVLEVLARRYPERFSTGGDTTIRRWMARIILIENYLQFQNDIFNLKMHIRGKEIRNRRSNHFILTPFDVFRGRGLRIFGREIASSLAKQIPKKPV